MRIQKRGDKSNDAQADAVLAHLMHLMSQYPRQPTMQRARTIAAELESLAQQGGGIAPAFSKAVRHLAAEWLAISATVPMQDSPHR